MRALVVVLVLIPAAAGAQDLPLAQVLPDLILREIVLLPGLAGPAHVAHFSPLTNELNNPVVDIVHGFNTQMATQFSTFPLGSSTGGLTYVFDESVGTFRRASMSFGPLFAERALTIGRRKLNAGFNYQHTSYRSFEGQRLDNGTVTFYLRHQDCCHFDDPANLAGFTLTPLTGTDRLNPPFKGDVIEAALSLRATTHTTAAFANYGVTDRWDIGVAVPFVRVNLDASVKARIIRLVTATAPDTHTFEYGHPDATQTVRRSDRANGLGDVVLRTKYQLLRAAGGGLAAAVDLRLPTGKKEELLGAGGTETKFLLIASGERGRLGQHVNIGYTAAHGTVAGTVANLRAASLPDEINYTGGVELMASPRITLMGDVVGRTLRGAGQLDFVSKSFEYNDPTLFTQGLPGPGCGGLVGGFTCRTASFEEFAPKPGNLTLLLGAAGAKWNVKGNALITGSVLFPLTDAGLRSRVTTVVGLDYAF
jgi:outer membrane putative beta-barrel porin/alpha-amylase